MSQLLTNWKFISFFFSLYVSFFLFFLSLSVPVFCLSPSKNLEDHISLSVCLCLFHSLWCVGPTSDFFLSLTYFTCHGGSIIVNKVPYYSYLKLILFYPIVCLGPNAAKPGEKGPTSDKLELAKKLASKIKLKDKDSMTQQVDWRIWVSGRRLVFQKARIQI